MTKPLNWYHTSSMVRNGKGVCSVVLGDIDHSGGSEIVRVGNDAPNGISLRSGSVSAIHQAIKRLEATIKEMEQTATQIEKYGLDTSK